jgi:hypothetical protein
LDDAADVTRSCFSSGLERIVSHKVAFVVSAQAQDHGMATLKAEKADLFSAVVAAAGADDELSNPKARVTILAPSDAVSTACTAACTASLLFLHA